MIPIILRLKKANHKEVAKSQDIIVQTLFEIFDNAVLHGGTAIWRCYSGNRFSEDVDAYTPKDTEKLNLFFSELEKKGFQIKKKKISDNSIYSALIFNRTPVKFEATFKRISGTLKEYETSEGNFLTIYTLTPEEFIIEKVSAYLNRLKIRDLYDIFFLLRYISNISSIIKDLEKLIRIYKNPKDEEELKIIILEGLVPKTEKMLDYIKSRIKNG
jgi:predicted nucleotidyltransferase component of viral defense system